MTINEIRKLLKHKKVESYKIENHIHGERKYDEWEPGKYYSKFVPYTNCSIFSDWMICVSLPHSNYMWIKIYHNTSLADGKHEYNYGFEYIWKAGPGKKMRKDAAWNIFYKMMQDVGNWETDEEIVAKLHRSHGIETRFADEV